MADHLSDEEQLQAIKQWWKENGRFLIICVAVSVSAYFGWQWWTMTQQDQAEQASTLYSELVSSIAVTGTGTLSDEKATTATFLIEQLKSDFSDSIYAVNAALVSAKLAVDKGDLATAATELRFAIDHGDSNIQAVAKHRLARIYLAQKNLDQALELASHDKEDAFASQYADLRGDIYAAKNDTTLAADAYQQALDNLVGGDAIQRNLIAIKLADLSASGE